jgi:hypothetical protein
VKKLLILATLFLLVSVGLNVYLFLHKPDNSAPKTAYVVNDMDAKIKDIESYLDSISSSYMADEQRLAAQENLPSWGCGPSSYALAKIINKKFFDDNLIINASYNNKNTYEIIERFGLADDGTKVVDHAWLEIYFKDKFLFIDPSIGQFGKINKIAYQIFTVGQSDIQNILKTKYGIEDVRLSLLVQKVVNRIPVDQPPYPGMTIAQQSINYFLIALEDRNSVNDGIEPAEWQNWVSFLMNKYIS